MTVWVECSTEQFVAMAINVSMAQAPSMLIPCMLMHLLCVDNSFTFFTVATEIASHRTAHLNM